MSNAKTIDEIVAAVREMDQEGREDLLLRLAQIDDLMEDLEDVADLLRAARESSRPFDEFLAELRAERSDL
jgi:uncharacterized protein Yka (UPF0111/DUF47 family)